MTRRVDAESCAWHSVGVRMGLRNENGKGIPRWSESIAPLQAFHQGLRNCLSCAAADQPVVVSGRIQWISFEMSDSAQKRNNHWSRWAIATPLNLSYVMSTKT